MSTAKDNATHTNGTNGNYVLPQGWVQNPDGTISVPDGETLTPNADGTWTGSYPGEPDTLYVPTEPGTTGAITGPDGNYYLPYVNGELDI